MERLFTERQWRAIAQVEDRTFHRPHWDGFHVWCAKRRLCGPTYLAGEFYLGWRDDESEFRVFERYSGLDFSDADNKGEALDEAAGLIRRIGDYLPDLLALWTPWWEERRVDMEQREAERRARLEKKEARKAAGRKLSRRARAVFEASGGQCHYCGTALTLNGEWHIEHKFPRALFGGSEQSNLVAACAPCNHRKNDKTDLEFQALLAANASDVTEAA